MKFVANLIGILSIPVYYVVLAFLFAGLFAAFDRLSAFLRVEPWLLGGAGIWFVIPVAATLSLWFSHMTYRFLLRRWSYAADVPDDSKADADTRS